MRDILYVGALLIGIALVGCAPAFAVLLFY
jgi:hypothetical protein